MANEVKRYWCDGENGMMVETDSERVDKWVSESDYAALEAKLSEAEKERDEWKTKAEGLQSGWDEVSEDAKIFVKERDAALLALEEAREALKKISEMDYHLDGECKGNDEKCLGHIAHRALVGPLGHVSHEVAVEAIRASLLRQGRLEGAEAMRTWIYNHPGAGLNQTNSKSIITAAFPGPVEGCVCAETSSRNCPVHQNLQEKTKG